MAAMARSSRLVFLCRQLADSLDNGINNESYVQYRRGYARRIFVYKPMPSSVEALRKTFSHDVIIKPRVLSDKAGATELPTFVRFNGGRAFPIN